jgi:hypothetical protein
MEGFEEFYRLPPLHGAFDEYRIYKEKMHALDYYCHKTRVYNGNASNFQP